MELEEWSYPDGLSLIFWQEEVKEERDVPEALRNMGIIYPSAVVPESRLPDGLARTPGPEER
jgi:hypothetical protein